MPAKILVVEDDPDARQMLQVVLSDEGYTVLTAEDGQAALRLLDKECPDLVVTDIQMPNLDGIGLTRSLRGCPQWRKIPVLVLTAQGSEGLAEAMMEGANEGLRKPAQLASVIDLIKRLLAPACSVWLLTLAGITARVL